MKTDSGIETDPAPLKSGPPVNETPAPWVAAPGQNAMIHHHHAEDRDEEYAR